MTSSRPAARAPSRGFWCSICSLQLRGVPMAHLIAKLVMTVAAVFALGAVGAADAAPVKRHSAHPVKKHVLLQTHRSQKNWFGRPVGSWCRSRRQRAATPASWTTAQASAARSPELLEFCRPDFVGTQALQRRVCCTLIRNVATSQPLAFSRVTITGASWRSLAAAALPLTSTHQTSPSAGPGCTAARMSLGISSSTAFSRSEASRARASKPARVGESSAAWSNVNGVVRRVIGITD